MKRPASNQIAAKRLIYLPNSVWDVNASFINNEIAGLSLSKSNGSVAGIVSMPGMNSLGFLTNAYQRAHIEATRNRSTIDGLITGFEQAMSRALAVPLIVNTIPGPVEVAQRRITRIITQLPIASFWLLVAANANFALLALCLAVFAIRASSAEVHQTHTRLTTAGMVAQLFNWRYARRKAKDEKELFEEHVDRLSSKNAVIRVSVRTTDVEGVEFIASRVESTVEEDPK